MTGWVERFVAPFRRDEPEETSRLVGVITRKDMEKLADSSGREPHHLADLARCDVVVAYPDEPLRVVVYRMAEAGVTRMPVVERGESRKLVGMVSLEDLLRARSRSLTEERARERVLRVRLPFQRDPEAA